MDGLLGSGGPVAVIGGGFSGSALAIALLERGASVTLVERSGEFGPGLAYGTVCDRHLLNVRSARMSLDPRAPDDFTRWLWGQGLDSDPEGFARRADFGRYIRHRLEAAAARAPERLMRRVGEAVAVEEAATGAAVVLADGARLPAGPVVLATGNPPPGALPIPGLDALGRAYLPDPWARGALDQVRQEDDLFLVGAGLTAVDVLLALESAGWRGRATAVSRRGLLPRTHGAPADAGEGPPPDGRLSQQLRAVRRQSGREPWTEVLDRMRPHHQDLWRAASLEERRRFLRHLRAWWDVHRHRMAPEIGAQVDRWLEADRLAVRSGRLIRAEPEAAGAGVVWRARGGGEVRTPAAWVINCTGPEGDPSRAGGPLIAGLLRIGAARVDPLGLGLDTDADGRIIERDGQPHPWLSAVGPPTRGALWEIVAVPEIRQQAQAVAERLTADGGGEPRGPAGPFSAFTDHPRDQGETYLQHMGVAFSFGGRLLIAGAAACVHGLAPFLFKKAASRAICDLHAELMTRRRPPPRPRASPW